MHGGAATRQHKQGSNAGKWFAVLWHERNYLENLQVRATLNADTSSSMWRRRFRRVPARCGGMCSASTDVFHTDSHSGGACVVNEHMSRSCRDLTLVGLDGRQGEYRLWRVRGARQTHPADRAAGYYGFGVT